ncbi:MAG: pilus assembly PilX N-terminal domain-containing protein [Vicinamibacteria bacterium]|nr:pilus assembly PilX N-terminal domain-containing protein [Vicinamibacteria bacterium]
MALILALMSLIILTFLGLTLAASTSTELNIAMNNRLSRQAYYNAEAGLAVGRWALSQVPDWSTILPVQRPSWILGTSPIKCAPETGTRDCESQLCDENGSGMGFGRVLRAPGVAGNLYQDVTIVTGLGGLSVNGAFTLWVRRDLQMDETADPPLIWDNVDHEQLILLSEGVAPIPVASSPLTYKRRAVHYLETLVSAKTRPCCTLTGSKRPPVVCNPAC